jgi:tRNA A37 methylthiotransferase MiaB
LWDENEVKVEERLIKSNIYVSEGYYQKLLGASYSPFNDTLASRMEQLVPHILSEDQIEGLMKLVSADDQITLQKTK